MNWNINIQATVTNPANYLVAAIYDHSAPTIVVDSIALPKPYGSSIQIVFTNVQAIEYDFKLFESPDTTPQGTIRSFFVLQPTSETTQVREDLYLVANESVNFTSGTTSYTADAPNDLTGWNYSLERVGLGTQRPAVDWAKDANGWHLLTPGDQIQPGEKFVLHFIPIVQQASISPAAVNLITATRIITTNTALDNTDMTKAMLIQGAGDYLEITMPLLSTVADNKLIMLISAGGNHINAAIKCAGADQFLLMDGGPSLPNSIPIAQNEQFGSFKANGVWNLFAPTPTIWMGGEIVYNYHKLSPNTIFANGAEVSRTAYAKLWKEVQRLESGVVINDSDRNNTQVVNGRTVFVNHGKYTFGNGTTTFRLPKIYTVGNLKAIDGTSRLPSSYEADMTGPHNHTFTVPASATSTTQSGQGRFVGGSDGFEPANMPQVTTDNNSGTETKEANFGIYALIRI
jgi:hypothetical protein